MAAVSELSVLLFALIGNIHAGERLIQWEQSSYTFSPPKEADFCLISRVAGEERLVLWNTSDLSSKSATVPGHLAQQLLAVRRDDVSSFVIHNLTRSDSGLYQEECWAGGKGTHEKNTSITICSKIDGIYGFPVAPGEVVDQPCEEDDLDSLWLKHKVRHKQGMTDWVFGERMSVDDIKGLRFQEVQNTSVLHLYNYTTTTFTLYVCLLMRQQQCVRGHILYPFVVPEMIYGSVEETAVLPCTLASLSDDQPPHWMKYHPLTNSLTELGQNFSLVLPSLTLNHTAWYSCRVNTSVQRYLVFVCPKLGPSAVQLFSEGAEVQLTCRGWNDVHHAWFFRPNHTGGRIFSTLDINFRQIRRILSEYNGSLVISNASAEDEGDYWCAALKPDFQCLLRTRTLLQLRRPFGVHSTTFAVRCSLLGGLLVALCVTVVAVSRRRGRGGGEQPSAETIHMFTHSHDER